MKQIIATAQAPKAIGPYSQAVIWQGLAFLSGQIPLDPATNQIIAGDIAAQTERVLENLKVVLAACGSSLAQVLKTTVYLKDMSEFPRMNEVYAGYFPENPPARATVEAARLPRDVRIEIDAIAAAQDPLGSSGRPVRHYVGIEDSQQAVGRGQQDAVTQGEAKQLCFVGSLHPCGGHGYRDALQADHLSHDAAGGVGGGHQHRIQMQAIRRNHLQVSEQGVGRVVGTGKEHP